MSGTIKELSLSYDPVNKSNTFSNGDVIQGRVFLEVSKEVKIDSLYIKCKGDADVRWTESNTDDTDDTYHSHERYFKLKQCFILDPSKKAKNEPNVILISGETYGNVVKPGRHVFPFSFQLPHRNMPPSFKAYYGSVKYVLEVTLDRSWKMDRTAKAEINFVPRVVACAQWMNSQCGTVNKKMKFFTSGSTSMRATIDRTGYRPGDVINVSTHIDNSSSRKLRLKYRLDQKQTFYAQGSTKHSALNIFKVVGDFVPSGSKQAFTSSLTIPSNLEQTIANCSIMKMDYIFKVYLDVPYASDPEIIFSVVILPADQPGFQFYEPNPPAQPVFGPSPPIAAHPPTMGLYPSLYPPPAYSQPGNPDAPPPSYTDIYPYQNQAIPGFQQTPSAQDLSNQAESYPTKHP